MDYQFENLGDERFQELCSALINKEFPNSQAFPVGQRDGGRDSLAYLWGETNKRDFIVFQVKYVRNAKVHKDPHKWFVKTIEEEIDKINNLILKGAKAYYLLTNVNGTAFLDSGSIDIMNKLLDSKIKIPSICWWRDDLCGKIDNSIDLKWSYPEIINGQDILNSIVFNNINENRERRETVIKTYLADQYEIENEVKFKQIELQNNLLDLFIDVPIRPKDLTDSYKFEFKNEINKIYNFKARIYEDNQESDFQSNDILDYDEKGGARAAYFLLRQKRYNRILLEGGPGQGKSTITQYLCQMHRMRLLDKQIDIAQLPAGYRNIALKLPFKIDLRDLAIWVERKNPYSNTINEEYFNKKWSKSLEAFLVAHIFYHSQNEDFDLSDFQAISKLSSILFVFDGFDEIADRKIREDIIELINKGLNRLSQYSKSILVIITSRPAAFANSASFSTKEFAHFELADINLNITNEYVEKWIKSKKIKEREANDLRKIVEEKLKMSYLQDLAKSPMQLAILISLINTRGESLPNKRTALYDSYIELFFNRESEKNVIIRDHRELIINIHQYLAWVLHSDAELSNSNGRIDANLLQGKLKKFLENEGHSTEIAETLFSVVEERVCAIVSRIQGTFEFEVQPLREYFCAKYLYITAPYSPTGSEKTGTKPDRFDALAQNYYWQNVLRFFAGCFDKGEIPMLIERLETLQDHEYFKYTNYTRILTSQLLSDLVFSQYPKLLKQVLNIIINGINIGAILNQNNRSIYKNEPIVLPLDGGRVELLEECFKELKKFPADDYAFELIGLMNNNTHLILPQWSEIAINLEDDKLTKWLEYGYNLQLFHKIDSSLLIKLVTKDNKNFAERFQLVIDSHRVEVFEEDFQIKQLALDFLLNDELKFNSRKFRNTSIWALTSCFNISTLKSLITSEESIKSDFHGYLNEIYRSHFDTVYGFRGGQRVRWYVSDNSEIDDFLKFSLNDDIDKKIHAYFESIKMIMRSEIGLWRSSIEPWDKIVQEGKSHFGDHACFNIIAIIASGIKSFDEKCNDYSDLGDETLSICKRVRYARLKSGNSAWWEEQIEKSHDLVFTLSTFFSTATPKTIILLIKFVGNKVEGLERNNLKKLFQNIIKTAPVFEYTLQQQKQILSLLDDSSIAHSIKYLISLRIPLHKRMNYLKDFLADYKGDIEEILQLKYEYLIGQFGTSSRSEKVLLAEIKNTYFRSKHTANHSHQRLLRNTNHLSYDEAKMIMKDCKNYPNLIVTMAENVCRIKAYKNVKAVGKIAKSEKWFDF